MGFADKLKDLAGKAGAAVNKGIESGKESYNKMAEKNRLKKEISQLTTDINNSLMNVGRQLYTEQPEHEQFKDVFVEVKEKEEKIVELNKQISIVDGAIPCPNCGELIAKGTDTCEKCGTKIEVAPPATETAEASDAETGAIEVELKPVVTCPQCGATLEADAKFCNQCGKALSD